MTSEDKRLCAALLRLASDVFANHGCNDFDLAEYISDPEDRDQMVYEAYGEEVERGEGPYDWRLGDHFVMDLMAKRLDAEAALG